MSEIQQYAAGHDECGTPIMERVDEGGYVCFDDHEAELTAMRERAEAAEAIIKNLPMIGRLVGEGEDRKIVFDVVATLESEVHWLRPNDSTIHAHAIIGIAIDRHARLLVFKFASGSNGFACQCYNTRAAAEFAIEQAKGISS